MRIYLDCIPCFVRQSLEAARHATDDVDIHEQVLRGVLELTQNLDMHQSPPAIAQHIHRLIRKLAGVDDPYHGVKQRFNDMAMKLYSQMRQVIVTAPNPLETAVRLAIAGNIIDFGIKSELQEDELLETVDHCLTDTHCDLQIDAFGRGVDEAQSILYLSDNAGEIVFDRLLIEQLPFEKITVAVKGAPIINDATMEDADYVGLPKIVDVIDNGSDAPGTILEHCSDTFRDHFQQADLVIAKGQGNYETLSDVDKPIVFILKAKCPVIAEHLKCNVGDMILRIHRT